MYYFLLVREDNATNKNAKPVNVSLPVMYHTITDTIPAGMKNINAPTT